MDVKTLCLGVLTLRDMTGYEIKKHFEQSFAHFFVAGYGSIYPALSDLTRAGLVSCQDVAQAKRPDKKVYSITETGRAQLAAALAETPPRHKVRSEFLVLLYFAHLLSSERLAEVLDQRVRDIDSMIASIDAAFAEDGQRSPSHDLVAGLGYVTLRAQRDYILENRQRWLESVRAEQGVPLSKAG
ncbi:MAG: PadR family transcriptional regulator [Gammaproteobacteria bacterium]|nr:PadR family transcriptional regulator [Gammaproteobacteria bacterium]NIM74018.1 PadR family transcriptional regulator [Gammaproteobacteria bacterium]NIN38900.1 PadR family transcriptional regulator [Gammaproteobacteria bacterium]NIO25793.1 PadR family transcriptional regulator [Gammaproteobacteria bacterium]NIO66424.1 PadR family transcriptional regulator [Gammaproteobacteria bacterium]